MTVESKYTDPEYAPEPRKEPEYNKYSLEWALRDIGNVNMKKLWDEEHDEGPETCPDHGMIIDDFGICEGCEEERAAEEELKKQQWWAAEDQDDDWIDEVCRA